MMNFFARNLSAKSPTKWGIFAPIIGCYQLTNGLLLTLLSLTSLSMMAPAVWAQQYQPPTGEPPGGPRGSNGSRDACGEAYAIPLTGLAPLQHMGQTTTTTPTFVWFIPATAQYSITLSFYKSSEGSRPELLHEVEYSDTTSGIVEFTLPADDEFELSLNQPYEWQVSIDCNPNSLGYDQSFVSTLEITEPPTTLTEALAAAQTPVEKATIYAEAGYWYDALREAMIASDNSNRDSIASSLLNELAELEGGLHGYYLTQIIEVLTNTERQVEGTQSF